MAEALRVLSFVLIVLNLAILISMVRVYLRLMRDDPISRYGTPSSMLYFCGGFALVMLGQFWRSVQYFHTEVSMGLILFDVGTAVSLYGLFKLQVGVTDRERYRVEATRRRLAEDQQ